MKTKEITMNRFLCAALSVLAASLAIGQDSTPGPERRVPQSVWTNTITGRCHCGTITYEADGARAKSDECECRGCQRASGSPVFWKSNNGEQIDIFAGTLDDSRAYKPKK
jgi:hypothetical protein